MKEKLTQIKEEGLQKINNEAARERGREGGSVELLKFRLHYVSTYNLHSPRQTPRSSLLSVLNRLDMHFTKA